VAGPLPRLGCDLPGGAPRFRPLGLYLVRTIRHETMRRRERHSLRDRQMRLNITQFNLLALAIFLAVDLHAEWDRQVSGQLDLMRQRAGVGGWCCRCWLVRLRGLRWLLRGLLA